MLTDIAVDADTGDVLLLGLAAGKPGHRCRT
jgi:hypothetical protein